MNIKTGRIGDFISCMLLVCHNSGAGGAEMFSVWRPVQRSAGSVEQKPESASQKRRDQYWGGAFRAIGYDYTDPDRHNYLTE